MKKREFGGGYDCDDDEDNHDDDYEYEPDYNLDVIEMLKNESRDL